MKAMKKFAALVLSTTVLLTSLTGCESHKSVYATSAPAVENTVKDTAAQIAKEGKVLNICAWNDEFMKLMEKYYPDYKKVNATSGKIGDITVNWFITSNEKNAYQDNLDMKLFRQRAADANSKIDIFLIESDYAVKYINSSFAMNLQDLGIQPEELHQQYRYTQTVASDSGQNMKAVSWQACPGALIYNREIAKAAFGTDEPSAIQQKVADWTAFEKSAAAVKAKGYYMLSGYDDTYRVFSNNVSSPWISDNGISVDENLLNWVDQTMNFTEKEYNNTTSLWDDEWKNGFYPDGKVFCYFGPAWLFAYSMDADKEGSVANSGNWAVTKGPETFFWGGSWICAASETDNPALVADIMRKFTIDSEIMKKIAMEENEFVNNKSVMQELAKDTSYSIDILGGQNPFSIFCEGADKINLRFQSYFDQGCNEEFMEAMKRYYDGYLTKEEALEEFEKKILKRYPTLKEE